MEELRNFSLEESGSIRTDFAPGADCYQKVVRFCRDGSKLVTGGMEGVVRVWRVSQRVCVSCVGRELNLKITLINNNIIIIMLLYYISFKQFLIT